MEEKKKVYIVLIVAVIAALLVGMRERMSPAVSADNTLKRNANGEGSYEEELELSVKGIIDNYNYRVEVPERALTKQEELSCLQDAWSEIQREFPGENEGLHCIREKVEIHDTYEEGRVEAEWSFDNYKVMDFDGNVIAEKIPAEGELVCAAVELSCGDSAVCKAFCFQVFQRELTEEEKLLGFVQEKLLEQERESGTDLLKLPEQMGDYKLVWKKRKTHLPAKIILLGVVTAGLLPFVEKNREREAEKKKSQELAMEYPEVVSKLSILLSAGMTLQRAWKKIALSYEQKREMNEVRQMPAYEEMLVVCRELESGRGEERAYERFGERCGQSDYRKLGHLLAQNLRKGNRGIVVLLEKEAENAFEERKQAAKRYGEEATTKLLFPMMLMFGMILLILIVPAVAAFRI